MSAQTYTTGLPATGFIRQAQLIGESPVTPEQAEANKRRGKGPKRARSGTPAIVPWSSATLWRKIKAGQFCAPVKISAGITAFRVEDVRQWLDAQSVKARTAISQKAITASKAKGAAAAMATGQ